jgi:hypothetical protein
VARLPVVRRFIAFASVLGLVAALVVGVSGAGAATGSGEGDNVAEVLTAFGPKPLPDKRPPGWIAIDKVSDSCGLAGTPFRAHDQTYTSTDGRKLKVDFADACDLHDAAYSGALVWDRINGQFVDFSDPYWTKDRINDKFKLDLQRMCFRNFPPGQDAPGAPWKTAFELCLGSDELNSTLIPGKTWGALSWHRVVTQVPGVSPRERVNLAGTWKNLALGWPLCDIGVAHPMTITQGRIKHDARFEPVGGREIVAKWIHGTAGYRGEFKGTLITGDKEGDDIVVGTFIITEGGNKVGGGPMTIKVTSDDKFDYNGSGQGGTMVRRTRSTQGLLLSTAQPRCKKTSKPAVGSFVLTSTRVTNPNAPELTIDAAGGKATWDHTGQYGGAGKGGEWKVAYTFKVPQTLIPGKSFSLTLGLAVSNVVPVQPLAIQIGARAPDFVGGASVNYPNPASASKAFSVPLSMGYKDFKEILVIVGVVSAEVTYVYRRVGG